MGKYKRETRFVVIEYVGITIMLVVRWLDLMF